MRKIKLTTEDISRIANRIIEQQQINESGNEYEHTIEDVKREYLPEDLPIKGDGYTISLDSIELGDKRDFHSGAEITITLTLDSLDLGNNFTSNHFTRAIAAHRSSEEFMNILSNEFPSYDTLIKIKADIKFGYRTEDIWVLNEFIEWVEMERKNVEDYY